MSRRTIPVEPCLWPECPQVGRWQKSWCPQHHPQAMARLRPQVDAARRERLAAHPPTDNLDPCAEADPIATASAQLGGTPMKGNR